jgi:hypothetical protein
MQRGLYGLPHKAILPHPPVYCHHRPSATPSPHHRSNQRHRPPHQHQAGRRPRRRLSLASPLLLRANNHPHWRRKDSFLSALREYASSIPTEYDRREPFKGVAIYHLFIFLVTFSNVDSNCIRISLCIISAPSSYGPLPFAASSVVHRGCNAVTPSLSPRPTSVFNRAVTPVIHTISRAVSFRFFDQPHATRLDVTPQISPGHVPLPRSPSLPTASPGVSMSSPRGSIPSIRSDLMTIPSSSDPHAGPEGD